MKNTTLVLLLSLASAGCAQPEGFYCYSAGSSCTELVAGFSSEAEAASFCGSSGETVGTGTCGATTAPLGHCTQSVGAQTWIVGYLGAFGDGTAAYARMTCDFVGGEYAAP